jgi:hypothetical protein
MLPLAQHFNQAGYSYGAIPEWHFSNARKSAQLDALEWCEILIVAFDDWPGHKYVSRW